MTSSTSTLAPVSSPSSIFSKVLSMKFPEGRKPPIDLPDSYCSTSEAPAALWLSSPVSDCTQYSIPKSHWVHVIISELNGLTSQTRRYLFSQQRNIVFSGCSDRYPIVIRKNELNCSCCFYLAVNYCNFTHFCVAEKVNYLFFEAGLYCI